MISPSFDARFDVTMRDYEFMLPLHLLACSSRSFDVDDHYAKVDDSTVDDAEIERWRLAIESQLRMFEGTKNYHNFTTNNDPSKATNMRYLEAASVERFDAGQQPESISKLSDVFLLIRLRGASFMYHQIRRMVGLVVQLTIDPLGQLSSNSPTSVADSLSTAKRLVWTAPSAGLLLAGLDLSRFDFKADRLGLATLKMSEIEACRVKRFKESRVYEAIVHSEKVERVFGKWLASMLDADQISRRQQSLESLMQR